MQAQPIDLPPTHVTPPHHHRHRRVPGYAGWVIAAIAFATMAPMLSLLAFSNGIEQLHTATVLEMRREEGSWLMPTLNGKLRIKKPPLPAWIGALAISDSTVAGASAADRATRDAAFTRLAWEIRWPVLLIGCLTLAATFDLARTLAGRRAALWAAIITASSLLFLRFMRLASTDVHLALWVITANAMLARAILRRQDWSIVAAGLAIGLAFMCKGPVAILQTLLPAAIALLVFRRRGQAFAGHSLLLPGVLSVAAFLAIALPWPILVWMSDHRALATWWQEITREGDTDHEYKPPWSYLSLLPNLMPWLPAFVLGCLLTFRHRTWAAAVGPVARHRGYLLALLWLAVPIVVMSLFRDKSERYLLPMLPAAAIIAARGLLAALAGIRRGRRDAGALLSSHLVITALIALVLPALGAIPAGVLPRGLEAIRPSRLDGSAWYAPAVAAIAIVAALAVAAAMAWLLRRGRRAAATAVAAAVMLAANALFLRGYRHSADSQSEMRPLAEQILVHAPDATVAYHEPDGKAMPQDLAIYLNRVVRPLSQIRKHGEPEPQVVVMLQRDDESPPRLEGWRAFAVQPYRRHAWYALEPAPAE